MTDISVNTRVEVDEGYPYVCISQDCGDNAVYIDPSEIPSLIEALINAEKELGGGLGD
jgi:hypothetical protein